MSTLNTRALDSAQASAFRGQPHKAYGAVENTNEVLIAAHADGGEFSFGALSRMRDPERPGIVRKLRTVRVGSPDSAVRAVVPNAIELLVGSLHGSSKPFGLVTLADQTAVLITTAEQAIAA